MTVSRRLILQSSAALLLAPRLSHGCALGTEIIHKPLSEAPGEIGYRDVIDYLRTKKPQLGNINTKTSNDVRISIDAYPNNPFSRPVTIDYLPAGERKPLIQQAYLILENWLIRLSNQEESLQPSYEQIAQFDFSPLAQPKVSLRIRALHPHSVLHVAYKLSIDGEEVLLLNKSERLFGLPCRTYHYSSLTVRDQSELHQGIEG